MEEQLWYEKYRPLELLHSGNDTEIFLTEYVKLSEKRVIKASPKGGLAEERIRHEAAILSKISHPCVVSLYDLLETEKEIALVEQYLEGVTLAELIRTEKLKLKELLALTVSLCETLEYLHSPEIGVFHCDLQPSNLLICGRELKIIDFGAAVMQAGKAEPAFSYGTDGYFAPEQKEGEVSCKTDIYAVGRLILTLLAQATEHLNPLEGLIKGRIERVAEKASRVDSSERFESVTELKTALLRSRVLRGEGKNKAEKASVCTVIGIAGTHHGVGVTHTALTVAKYLHYVKNKRVALIELSETQALRCYEKAGAEYGSPCRLAGFHVFTAADNLLVGSIRNGKYDYCILDLGCASKRRLEELLRCDIKLLVSDSAPWRVNRRGQVDMFLSYAENLRNWWLLFNLSDRINPPDCKGLPVRTEYRQFTPNPLELTAQDEKLLGKILSAV